MAIKEEIYTQVGSRNSNYTLKMTVQERAQGNSSTNTSIVDWTLQLLSSNNYYFSGIGMTVLVYINGTKVVDEYAQRSIGRNGILTLASGSSTVEHNPDGTKTVSIEAYLNMNATDSYLPRKYIYWKRFCFNTNTTLCRIY